MLTIAEVRSSIASNVTRSRELRAAASAVRGLDRHRINLDRRTLGDETRCYLLLLAYLRGRTYRSVERHCTNAPSAYRMARILECATPASLRHDSPEVLRAMAATFAIAAWIDAPAEAVTAVAA